MKTITTIALSSLLAVCSISSFANEGHTLDEVADSTTPRLLQDIDHWERALVNDPNPVEPYVRLASHFGIHLDQPEKALALCLAGLRLHPANIQLNQLAMYAYFSIGEIDTGLAYYRILASMESVYFSIPRETLNAISQDMDKTLFMTFCNSYAMLNPNDSIIHERLAKEYMALREWELAQRHLEILLGHMPQSDRGGGEVYTDLGTCSYHLGDYGKALEYMTKARELGIDIPDVFISAIQRRIMEEDTEESSAVPKN